MNLILLLREQFPWGLDLLRALRSCLRFKVLYFVLLLPLNYRKKLFLELPYLHEDESPPKGRQLPLPPAPEI